ncbi:hypothetical protein PCANC_18932 [Puccinia coronata f. sp. avenae]|uniref:Cytoplasmic tRNA 2-thiolation protein 2 n=1 Tax=Puccinia coronata f. sp. avenae TaxID=200324 RepID=A0A2N5U6G8_9BASI|nr:hypothetical protein PCANC_18932 [Puccinia coronata f. sp. avenae]PLW33319.1 hypothetical protein PCASD_15535 [Puccinia coronata f. sp. avenae]
MAEKCCCKCQATTLLQLSTIRNTTWCRQCFIDQVNNKFFQGLKSAKEYCRPPPKTRDGMESGPASLVIHLKNDLSSILTLHLMRNYLNSNQERSTAKWKSPLDFSSIQVVWVDLGSASSSLAGSSETELPTDESLKSIVERLGFTFETLRLDDLFDSPASTPENPSDSTTKSFVDLSDPSLPIKTIDSTDPDFSTPPETAMMKPLANTLRPLTQTSRRSLIDSLVNKCLLDFCQHKPRHKVLVETSTSTQMAIDTLLAVSLGKGWSLDQQIGPSSYVNDVLICRPLAQIVDAELVQYSQLMELDHGYSLTYQSAAKKADIPSLITDFVVKLEENYPMTSSVINQTVNKIGKNKPVASASTSSIATAQKTDGSDCPVTTCPICQLSSDPTAHEWKQSITLSAHERPPEGGSIGGHVEPPAGQPATVEQRESMLLSNQLCYACLVTFNDHQYISHASRSDHDWVQLPSYYLPPVINHAPPPPHSPPHPSSPVNKIQAVLDEFLLED